MENTGEKSGNFLYPLRPSEIAHHPDFLGDIESLTLTKEEKEKISNFEKPFFEELQRLEKVSVSAHVIYPESFVGEDGNRLFSAIYLDEGLETRLKNLANQHGLDLKETSVKRQFYDAFFDDLLNIARSRDNFERYREEGTELTNLSKPLTELGGKSEESAFFKGEIPKSDGLSREDLEEKFFSEVDLASIPKQLRTRANRYSSEWAKEQFAQAFQNSDGNVDGIPNPERITRIVDVDKLTERVGGLRNFKRRLKRMGQELGDDDSDLTEAKKIVISLYQKYVNVLIAQEYDSGRILSAQPKRTGQEEEALGVLKGTNRIDGDDRFSPKRASRTLERIDHFLAGTGVRIGENGLFDTIPEKLAEYAQLRAAESPSKETVEYKKYNSYKVNAQQAQTLCEVILKKYGFTEGDKSWDAVVLERKGTLGVSGKEREVRIPKSFDGGLIDTLVVLSHEVEGHVLRYANQKESFTGGLRLTEELATGRSSILSEAAAMKVGDDTKQEMVGVKREALPYYYLTLLKKREGGSFKECFQTSFEAHAKRKYNLSLKEAINNEEIYREIFDDAYDRTLRIFRKDTPLDDTSGYLPTSEQLKYIEQELIVDVLREKGLAKLLYIAGIDLYSLSKLKRLGMLDLGGVKGPKMVAANEIWPRIKKALDSGEPLEKIIEKLN